MRFGASLHFMKVVLHHLAVVLVLFWSLIAFTTPVIADGVGKEAAEVAHAKMVLHLDAVESATPEENPFLGTANLQQRIREFQSLPEEASPADQFRALFFLAMAELEQGSEMRAIMYFEESIRTAMSSPSGNGVTQRDVAVAAKYLAIASLRLGEVENCCARPNPQSCIFPLLPASWHSERKGSEKAIAHLTQLLEKIELPPVDYGQAVWMLNLAYMTLGEHPASVPGKWRLEIPKENGSAFSAGPIDSPNLFPAFQNRAAELGVDSMSHAGGSIADDFDGDGKIDIVVCSWDPAAPMQYFRNSGSGGFLKQEAGLEKIRGGLNLKQADYDNDGDLDILVLRGAWLGSKGQHPNSLLQNDGKGNFRDVTYAVGLAEPSYPTQTAEWFDFDLDGDLDLFVGNETMGGIKAPCQLFENRGDRFHDISEEAGANQFGKVKAVTSGDFDGDRFPDIFLSRIEEPNLLLKNVEGKRFEDVSSLLGPEAGPVRSFPAWFFDYNNDGWQDLFVSGYYSVGPEYIAYYQGQKLPDHRIGALFENSKGEGFREVTREVGLDRPMLPMGSNFGDLTNNGFPDIYLGSGTPDYDAIVPNMLFVNDQGQFYDKTASSRMGHLQKGHGVSFADFDDDGDLDVFEQIGGAFRGDTFYDAYFENPGFGRNWLKVSLRGKQTNHFGIGARVAVFAKSVSGEVQTYYQWMTSGGSFGANPLQLHFGVDQAESIGKIEVFWPVTGQTQVIEETSVNQSLVIVEE